ncbi:MAG: hypothetical protein JJU29_00160 [Verrucomicrobia bacterium]|nr:hypothetical protein [Verrucomicrobiota bacterium]MCH8511028.1 hypothetical protein [Kiritimatiellia bacterium]
MAKKKPPGYGGFGTEKIKMTSVHEPAECRHPYADRKTYDLGSVKDEGGLVHG